MDQGQGWIKVYRKILDSNVWPDVTTFRLFFYLLLKASHEDGVEIGGIKLKRGQWIRSYRNLAKDLAYKEGRGIKEYSINTIHKAIGKLLKSGMITIQETELGTLFTIVNYAKYQGSTDNENKTVNGTVNEVRTPNDETGNNNKNAIMNKNAKKDNIYTPKIKDLLAVFNKNIPGFVDLNKRYWDVVRETRKTGSVSKGVIYNIMKKWEKYDPVVIEYALTTHIMNHAGKREEYTIGIMRRTNEHEARQELIKLKNKGGGKLASNQSSDSKGPQYDYGF